MSGSWISRTAERRIDAGIGSGVILSQDGLVLTNAHVAGPKSVEINGTLSNLERVGARLVGWDHWTDLSLLRINMDDARRRGLSFKHADFGDSDRLYVGQTVYAVGTPHGLTRTVTRGIISNNNRYFRGHPGRRRLRDRQFQHLAADGCGGSNPGNSGRTPRDRGRKDRRDHLASLLGREQPRVRNPLQHGETRRRRPGARRVDHAQLRGDRPEGPAGPGGVLRRRVQHRHAGRQRRIRLAGLGRGPARRRRHPLD